MSSIETASEEDVQGRDSPTAAEGSGIAENTSTVEQSDNEVDERKHIEEDPEIWMDIGNRQAIGFAHQKTIYMLCLWNLIALILLLAILSGTVYAVGNYLYLSPATVLTSPSTSTAEGFPKFESCLECRIHERCVEGSCRCSPGYKVNGSVCEKEQNQCSRCLLHCDKGECSCRNGAKLINEEYCAGAQCNTDAIKRVALTAKCLPHNIGDQMLELLLNTDFVLSEFEPHGKEWIKRKDIHSYLILKGVSSEVRKISLCDYNISCLSETLSRVDEEFGGDRTRMMRYLNITAGEVRSVLGDLPTLKDNVHEIDRLSLKSSGEQLLVSLEETIIINRYAKAVLPYNGIYTDDTYNRAMVALTAAYEADKNIFISAFSVLLDGSPLYANVAVRVISIFQFISTSFTDMEEVFLELDHLESFDGGIFEKATRVELDRHDTKFLSLSILEKDLPLFEAKYIHRGGADRDPLDFYVPLSFIHYCENLDSDLCMSYLFAAVIADALHIYIERDNNKICRSNEVSETCELRIFSLIYDSSRYDPGELYWPSRLTFLRGILDKKRGDFEYFVYNETCKNALRASNKVKEYCSLGADNIA